METPPWTSRWVPALSVAAVSLASLGAAVFGARTPAQPPVTARPAADQPVDVVRAPASPASAASAAACRTCEMGAMKGWL